MLFVAEMLVLFLFGMILNQASVADSYSWPLIGLLFAHGWIKEEQLTKKFNLPINPEKEE